MPDRTNAARQAQWRRRRADEIQTIRAENERLRGELTQLKLNNAQKINVGIPHIDKQVDAKSRALVDYTDRVNRMRALWNRGRQIYASFFAELDQALAELGDERLADWCFYELHISLSVCNKIAGILKNADTDRVREELKRIRRAQKENKSAERKSHA